MYVDIYSDHDHLHPLHPNGQSLTEDHMIERQRKQRNNVLERIEDLMNSKTVHPFTALTQAKLAHRGLPVEKLFDEAITAVREAFKMDETMVADESAKVLQAEAQRRAKIVAMAQESARRAGIEDDPRFVEQFTASPSSHGPAFVPPVPVTPVTPVTPEQK